MSFNLAWKFPFARPDAESHRILTALSSKGLSQLLAKAHRENLILISPSGAEFILAEINDFDREIQLQRGNTDLMAFLDRRGQQGNVSAYFADLLRKARQEQIDQDLKLLADGVQGAGPEPTDDEVVAPIKAIRRRMQREKWKPS